MVGKIILLLCALASLGQVYINASEVNDLQLAFRNVIAQIRTTDIPKEAVRLVFPNPEETSATLTDLLTTRSQPEVAEVLDVFNYNFGARLLVVNGEYVQVDPRNYQRFLSNHALTLARSIYPKNFFQQLVLYGMLQKQIQQISQNIRPDIENRKIPVQDVMALIASNGHRISRRDASENATENATESAANSDFLTDLINSVGTTVCNDLVGTAFAQLNNSLTSGVTFLDSISIEGGSSALSSLIANLVNLAVNIAKQLVTGLTEIAESLTSSICSDLFGSSRKRRDLPAGLVDRSNINTALSNGMTRDVAFGNVIGGLFDIAWNLISGLINTSLTSLVTSLLSVIESYFDSWLESTLGGFLNGLIASIFPQ